MANDIRTRTDPGKLGFLSEGYTKESFYDEFEMPEQLPYMAGFGGIDPCRKISDSDLKIIAEQAALRATEISRQAIEQAQAALAAANEVLENSESIVEAAEAAQRAAEAAQVEAVDIAAEAVRVSQQIAGDYSEIVELCRQSSLAATMAQTTANEAAVSAQKAQEASNSVHGFMENARQELNTFMSESTASHDAFIANANNTINNFIQDATELQNNMEHTTDISEHVANLSLDVANKLLAIHNFDSIPYDAKCKNHTCKFCYPKNYDESGKYLGDFYDTNGEYIGPDPSGATP